MMLASTVCSSLGDPDRGVRPVSSSGGGGAARVYPGRGARHVSSREGSLQCPPFNLSILLGHNGRVKNDCF